MQFHKVPLNKLEIWGQSLAATFLQDVEWKLGDTKIGESYCLQIEDDMIGYLDILPESGQFLWCTKDHHDSIHPDVASAYLIVKSMPGVKARCIIDDKTDMRIMEFEFPDGRKMRCTDSMEDGVRVFKFEPF